MEENESGTVTGFVPTQTDVRQNDKNEIVATTSNETLSHVISRDYIYKATYAIDSNMKPGHIFGLLRIHPGDCNKYVGHIAKMFKTWTGGMKIRARFMANFANGGSFRIGFLPPIFSQGDVFGLPLDTLTGYPNEDLDPKNTAWTEFRTSDQRNIHYHYMKDITDLTTADFGGWVVFYVVGSLVQTLQASGSVQMVVETAGDFDFRQLSPLSGGVGPVGGGPIPTDILQYVNKQLGCDDHMASGQNVLQVCSTANKYLVGGFCLASSLSGVPPEQASPNSKVSAYTSTWRTGIAAGDRMRSRQTFVFDRVEGHTFVFDKQKNNEWPCVNLHIKDLTLSATDSSGNYMYITHIAGAHQSSFSFLGDGGGWEPKSENPDLYVPRHNADGYSAVEPAKMMPADIFGENILQNQRQGESMLTFVNLDLRTLNIQTKEMADWLKKNPAVTTTDYLYTLHVEGTPGIAMYVRLQPCGMFTTNGLSSHLLITGNASLEYAGEISPSAPLPVAANTSSFVSFWHKVGKQAHKHGLTLQEAITKVSPLTARF